MRGKIKVLMLILTFAFVAFMSFGQDKQLEKIESIAVKTDEGGRSFIENEWLLKVESEDEAMQIALQNKLM